MKSLRSKKMRTYEQWKSAGRHVVKGERSRSRNAKGEALFSETQTATSTRFYGTFGNEGSDMCFDTVGDSDLDRDVDFRFGN
jgi:hypothetical protein